MMIVNVTKEVTVKVPTALGTLVNKTYSTFLFLHEALNQLVALGKGIENIRKGLAIKNVIDLAEANKEKVIKFNPEHHNTVKDAVEKSGWLPETAQEFIPFYDAVNGAQDVKVPVEPDQKSAAPKAEAPAAK